MNARGHIRRLDDVVRRRPQRDVAPIPDPLARAPRVPGGHRGDEGSLRAVLGKTLQTRTDLLDARAVEQPLRKPTGDMTSQSTLCRAALNADATGPIRTS